MYAKVKIKCFMLLLCYNNFSALNMNMYVYKDQISREGTNRTETSQITCRKEEFYKEPEREGEDDDSDFWSNAFCILVEVKSQRQECDLHLQCHG